MVPNEHLLTGHKKTMFKLWVKMSFFKAKGKWLSDTRTMWKSRNNVCAWWGWSQAGAFKPSIQTMLESEAEFHSCFKSIFCLPYFLTTALCTRQQTYVTKWNASVAEPYSTPEQSMAGMCLGPANSSPALSELSPVIFICVLQVMPNVRGCRLTH